MRLNLLYVHDTAIGYARYGVKLAQTLTKMGVEVIDHLDPEDTDPSNVACWVATPSHAHGWFDKQRAIISTMWETVNLPEGFRDALHNFHQIIVPSQHNVELFGRYHDNVVKVPLGVDSKEWAYRKRQPPERRFVFLIGGSGSRKGLDLAYAAYKKLWPFDHSWPRESPRPVLVFKSPRPIEWGWPGRIEWIGGKVSDEDERDIYGMAHCYLQPSRGEGFGLQPLQAIAQGCPTILTDAHGHAEFSHLGYGVSAKYSEADYFIYGNAGLWWEPDLNELCERMEYVYHNYEDAQHFADKASAEVHRHFTWERCAETFIAAIGKHHLNQQYRGTHTWQKLSQKRYLTRVLKPWRAEIGGSVYLFQPGQDYWELADVKRILWECGVLDPSCAFVMNPEYNTTQPEMDDVESGLTEQQLAKFKEYSAAHGHCELCGQKLNVPGMRYEPEFEDA